jgi:hypothetical protein
MIFVQRTTTTCVPQFSISLLEKILKGNMYNLSKRSSSRVTCAMYYMHKLDYPDM